MGIYKPPVCKPIIYYLLRSQANIYNVEIVKTL